MAGAMTRIRPAALVLASAVLAAGAGDAVGGATEAPLVVAVPQHVGASGRTVEAQPTVPGARAAVMRGAATLNLRATLAIASSSASRRFGERCAPGTPASVECFDVRGRGTVRGLGLVSLSSVQFVDTAPQGCPSGSFGVIGAPMRLSVAGKGTIELRLDPAAGCRTLATVLSHTRSYTIVGGTGAYSGATGSGSVRRVAGFAGGGASGKDTVAGTLSVPGLDFDLVPPSITGATARTARVARGAETARVAFSVKARDAQDGAVPVVCKPKSGASFRVGRTRVTCTATDTSGNTRAAAFWVTVRRG